MADMKAHKQQRQETTIPTTVPSPFGPTFTAPPQGLDHLPPLHSQCSRTYCSSSSTSHSCDCSRAEYKAQKKMLKAQAKTQKKESLWMAKEARHQAKEFKREAKHQAKQFKQEVRHQTKHAIKTARSNLRDRNYTYTGHYYPSNPSAPPLSLQVPQELRQIHSSGTVQPMHSNEVFVFLGSLRTDEHTAPAPASQL
ncbi:hypothetical protein BGX28_008309 [Mortierella sp. GBA30]|nr:hypothetical protein BGX28_008309 [Mortierella sp. GBA30]